MQIDCVDSIHKIELNAWNALLTSCTGYPFLRHEFLSALEDSGSTTKRTGWQPCHLLLKKETALCAAVPLFQKSHSYGEYVFDWSWADAYDQQGMAYYPKLLTAVPFTPSCGPRFLFKSQHDQEKYLIPLIDAIKHECIKRQCSGWHCLFPTETDCRQLIASGMQARLGCQFHWYNQNYRNFDDFLDSFTARKRKAVKRERRKVTEQGFTLSIKDGTQVTHTEWDQFYTLYHLTYLKRSRSTGYLGPNFFHLVADRLPQATLLATAYRNQEMIAAALYFRDNETLYGRYWGCREASDSLHFELCYYQGIEYAIANKLKRFDAGAQGEHKIQRGFKPVETWSNHWLRESPFQQAIELFVKQEAQEVLQYMNSANRLLPFKSID